MKNIKELIENINNQIKAEYKGCVSVSKLCNDYIKVKFDDVAQAEVCAKKGLNDPNYKYAGMTANQILEQWHAKSSESKRYGSLLDDYAGMNLNNETEKLELWKLDNGYDYDDRLKSICKGFDDFYNFILTKTNYKYVARELPLYCKTPKDGHINGRFDCLFYDETTDAYIIIDWKTTDDITTSSRYGKKLQGPAYMLDECDMNTYTIQLHVYKKALVETYGLSSYDKISVYVCNLLRQPNEQGLNFKLFKQNFDFDVNRLNTFIDFGNQKFKLMKTLSEKCDNQKK